MKIYNEIVLDMESWDIISEDFFEYSGPVSYLGGGSGGGTVTTGDPAYNRRMASISEEELEMARAYFDYYQYGQGEYHTTHTEPSSIILHNGKKWVQHGSDPQYYDATTGDPSGVFLDQSNNCFLDASGNTIATYTGNIYAAGESGTPMDSGAEITTTDGKSFGRVTAYAGGTTQEYVPEEGTVSFQDWETAQLQANMELLPGQTALSSEITAAARELLPAETSAALADLALQQGKAEAGLEALPWQKQLMILEAQYGIDATQLKKDALPWQKQLMMDEMYAKHSLLEGQAELIPEYYKQIAEGVNVEDEMAMSKSQVRQEAAGAEGQMRREMGRMGVDPTSGRYSSLRGAQLRETAAQVAGAGNKARRYAEDKQFERIKAGATAPIGTTTI
jgi:hypothetical protein